MEFAYLGIIWLAVFLLSTTLHEAAHAFVALKLGDPTAYHGGQVTLDPIPHMQREPVGMIAAPILSFLILNGAWMMGWASAPYDPIWAGRYPKKAAYMALAGPVSNLLLCLLGVALIHIGIQYDFFLQPKRLNIASVVMPNGEGMIQAAATLVSILFSLNLILFFFNLLPLPPLDGSALFPLFMEENKALRIMENLRQPGFMMVGLVIAWWVFGDIFRPIFIFFINTVVYPGSNYG